MIYPLVTGFHWADFDFQWYIEACRSRPAPARTASGFHSVETFISQPVHPGTDNIPIPEYVAATLRGEKPAGTTPFAVADLIDARADAAIRGMPASTAVPEASPARREFVDTWRDIEMMTLLGKYYAAKIRGATELAMFRASGARERQSRAIGQLETAAGYAALYAKVATRDYGPRIWTNRVGIVDFAELAAEARRDVDIARGAAATR